MNKRFFVLFGNQLFNPKILKALNCNHVFMAEDYELCTYQKHHKLKIYLFLCSMREYRDELTKCGIRVTYFKLEDRSNKSNYLDFLCEFLKKNELKQINFFEIEDKFLENRIIKQNAIEDFDIQIHRSPMFLFSREEFSSFHKGKSTFRLSSFYKYGRKKFKVLVNSNLNPIGDKWSFDEENRKKIPNGLTVPKISRYEMSKHQEDVINIINKKFSDHPGTLANIWFPVKRKQVFLALDRFLDERLVKFGIYEDAVQKGRNFLFHSCISPFLNIGLITPDEVIKRVLEHYNKGGIPINSIEGYIRQILGWREFIRGIYHVRGEEQEKRNFWKHKRDLCDSWYKGDTGIEPLDDCIKLAIADGYNHHIPRLMIISNIMTLCEIDPKTIYKWFMELYIDSSDWVMVPNVYGMATYADGGLMSTKPYTCSSNYILKMSNYSKGEWCDVMDGLYWRFIEKHKSFYKSNPRLAFQSRMLEKMKPERKNRIFNKAEAFLLQHTC
ncbi:MAG: cryptochrome/photolyase family protein [Rhodospirillaceae bacterium]|nr:cryptochrome/photolyase family protein [Rhodospirillaceae bacterium]